MDSDGGLGIVNVEGETTEELFDGSSLFSNIQPYIGRDNRICNGMIHAGFSSTKLLCRLDVYTYTIVLSCLQ